MSGSRRMKREKSLGPGDHRVLRAGEEGTE
jgi:hypothetical protein